MEAAGRSPRALGVRGGRCVLRDSWVEVVTAVSFFLFLFFVLYAFCFFQRGKENGLAVFSGYIRALARQKNTEWKRKSL